MVHTQREKSRLAPIAEDFYFRTKPGSAFDVAGIGMILKTRFNTSSI